MNTEKIVDTVTLLHLQQSISRFGAVNVIVVAVITGALALCLDYAYMLYLRSKMVKLTFLHSYTLIPANKIIATWPPTVAHNWKYFSPARQQAMDIL